MDVHSQLLIIGVLPEHSFGIMVAERKRVDRLASRTQHTRRCPPSVLPLQKGGRVGLHQKNVFFNVLKDQPVKAGWQCGQHAKHNLKFGCVNVAFMTSV